jgi:RNA polymerase sigma-70 factor (ECF subfamily)
MSGTAPATKDAMLHQIDAGAERSAELLEDRVSIERGIDEETVSQSSEQIERIVHAGAQRLLARASNARGLQAQLLTPRISAAVNKYVLRDSPSAEPARIDQFVDGLHADDLCLVIACERGDGPAWAELFEGYGTTVRSAARAASSNEDAAEDLAQSIWAELHGLKTRADGQPAGKLGYYSGAGSLGGWLRAVVGQLAIDRHRREARLVQPEEDADLDRLAHDIEPASESFGGPHSSPSPEEALASKLATADVERALAQAVSTLDSEDRLLMKLYYFDGLRLREAGAVLGVHEATASRRLTRIHREVRERVESILIKEHNWTKAEAARSLGEIASRLQVEIEPMLAAQNDSTLQSSPAGG